MVPGGCPIAKPLVIPLGKENQDTEQTFTAGTMTP